MVIISKGRPDLNIWSKIPNQSISSKDIILITWYNQAIKQKKINSQQQHLPDSTIKEIYYISYTSSN